MLKPYVYMDNHATTRVDPRVVQAMLPLMESDYGNAGSTSHQFGTIAKSLTDQSRERIAAAIGAQPKEIVFTSGATESNNLAIRGVAERYQRKGRHIVSVATEHRAVLDPVQRLQRQGWDVTLLPVMANGKPGCGQIDLQQLTHALRDDTVLVTVMLANNEVGSLQPLSDIGEICKQREVLLHSDATQAVGKIPVDVNQLQVDLLSFSAHKLYGPKGVGALYVRRRNPSVRLAPLIVGGGQEGGLRSGTLNTPGIVGLATALELCLEEMPGESGRLQQLRNRLYQGIMTRVDGVHLNGPDWSVEARLPHNLNLSFAGVDGEALMMSMGRLAVSSGSACTSANPEPSHVLRALGLDEDATRASLRFGLGRFNTPEEVDMATETIAEAVERLRKLGAQFGGPVA